MHTTPRYGDKPSLSLTGFRWQVRAAFPGVDFTYKADADFGFTATADGIEITHSRSWGEFDWCVRVGRLREAEADTLPDAVRNARAALTTTLDAARRLEMDR